MRGSAKCERTQNYRETPIRVAPRTAASTEKSEVKIGGEGGIGLLVHLPQNS